MAYFYWFMMLGFAILLAASLESLASRNRDS